MPHDHSPGAKATTTLAPVPALGPAPLVTAVIIFKNPGEYLAPAIDSVLAQTYANWELFLVDDGSTDVGTDIARRYAAQHPQKVTYLEHPGHANLGMSASRNRGVRAGRGELIAFLDADDLWTPEKLEVQIRLLRENPRAAMVYGPLKMWWGWTGDPKDAARDYVETLGVPENAVIDPPMLVSAFLNNEGIVPSGCLFHRAPLEAIGLCEEEFRDMCEDMVLHTKLELAYPVFATTHCSYIYRQHPTNCCATSVREGRYRAERLRYLHWTEQYMRDHGFESTDLWHRLQKAIRRERHPLLYSLLAARGFRWVSPLLKSLARLAPAGVLRRMRAETIVRPAEGA